jgi:hypothetical protein
MTTKTHKRSLPSCVPVGLDKTESVPQLSRTCVDESGGLVFLVALQDIEEAGAIFAPHGPSWTEPNPAFFLGAPMIFTRAREKEESITSSFLGPRPDHVLSVAYKEQAKRNLYRGITDDSGAGLLTWLVGLFRTSAVEDVVEQPISEPHLEALEWIKAVTNLSWEDVSDLLGVSHPTVLAWKQGKSVTRRSHRQRIFAVRDVLERAMRRHPGPSELTAWLDTPRGVEGKTPAELLGAGEIGQARLLATTSPSAKVKAPREWVEQRNMVETYQRSRERIEAVAPDHDEELLEMLDEDEE